MSFDVSKCALSTVWCGNKNIKYPKREGNKVYTKKGTPYECMQKGYGAGANSGKNPNSVGSIPYVSDTYVKRFKAEGIKTKNDLLDKLKIMSGVDKRNFLNRILKNKSGNTDTKAYNSVVYYLYTNNVRSLPSCI